MAAGHEDLPGLRMLSLRRDPSKQHRGAECLGSDFAKRQFGHSTGARGAAMGPYFRSWPRDTKTFRA